MWTSRSSARTTARARHRGFVPAARPKDLGREPEGVAVRASKKVFSQKFMEKYGIPTAAAGTFSDVAAAKKFCRHARGKCVVKPTVSRSARRVDLPQPNEAERAVDEIMVSKAFGAAGANVVIQEFLEGIEGIAPRALRRHDSEDFLHVAGSQARARRRPRSEHRRYGHVFAHPFLNDTQLAEVANKVLEPSCAAAWRGD